VRAVEEATAALVRCPPALVRPMQHLAESRYSQVSKASLLELIEYLRIDFTSAIKDNAPWVKHAARLEKEISHEFNRQLFYHLIELDRQADALVRCPNESSIWTHKRDKIDAIQLEALEDLALFAIPEPDVCTWPPSQKVSYTLRVHHDKSIIY
jgi:hypothetical protein